MHQTWRALCSLQSPTVVGCILALPRISFIKEDTALSLPSLSPSSPSSSDVQRSGSVSLSPCPSLPSVVFSNTSSREGSLRFKCNCFTSARGGEWTFEIRFWEELSSAPLSESVELPPAIPSKRLPSLESILSEFKFEGPSFLPEFEFEISKSPVSVASANKLLSSLLLSRH